MTVPSDFIAPFGSVLVVASAILTAPVVMAHDHEPMIREIIDTVEEDESIQEFQARVSPSITDSSTSEVVGMHVDSLL